jgi:hypothetical protein
MRKQIEVGQSQAKEASREARAEARRLILTQ